MSYQETLKLKLPSMWILLLFVSSLLKWVFKFLKVLVNKLVDKCFQQLGFIFASHSSKKISVSMGQKDLTS